jgi:hypothetical protein
MRISTTAIYVALVAAALILAAIVLLPGFYAPPAVP